MGAVWGDARILNISSRGLLIETGLGTPRGDAVELRRGAHVILAHVVWREGKRAGLQADHCIPVVEIMALSKTASLQLIAGEAPTAERRARPRSHEQSRLRSRAMEFASVALVASTFAAGAFAMVEEALARPLALVRGALGG